MHFGEYIRVESRLVLVTTIPAMRQHSPPTCSFHVLFLPKDKNWEYLRGDKR